MPNPYKRLEEIELDAIELEDAVSRQGLTKTILIFNSITNISIMKAYENYANYKMYNNRARHKTSKFENKKEKLSNLKEESKILIEPINLSIKMKQTLNGDFDEKGLFNVTF